MDDDAHITEDTRQIGTLGATLAFIAALITLVVLHRCAMEVGWIAICSIAALVGVIIVSDVLIPIGPSKTQYLINGLDRILGDGRAQREHRLRVLVYVTAIIVVSGATDLFAGR